MNSKSPLTRGQRWVVKIGSSLLTNDGQGLDFQRIKGWVDQLADLHRSGMQIILVSSGAVAAGMHRLGWSRRPIELELLQAAAAVGQTSLVQCYEQCFQEHQIHTAQILLTHEDLSDRKRYLNARNSLRTLLSLPVMPIINENDTVITDEIKFGDNDTLGALVANLMEADALIILTDQQGLYDRDPRYSKDAALIPQAKATDPSLVAMASGAGALGSGGMATKVRAAKLASRSGAVTAICAGREENVLRRLRSGEAIGTLLTPDQEPIVARKQWLAGHLKTRGSVFLDAGAELALVKKGRSLLPVGVSRLEGNFKRGEAVSCIGESGRLVAIGLINYDAAECGKILRRASQEIFDILGYISEPELIHRDNLVLME
ncbi:glutamate 5-kinase [Gynuella sunshinyii]|uniref:Glutamate 5-kinase n=1 Tax=Gynuella sunshinyii YC6258 TaxID=1445510 RepID=A0A0C5VAR2_9GAMM|nr:glutamate 5-kinase [Gynuella sunshinyii]AJQ96430.1 glutamate 5-kinase [Gynuella sunshinyii YC6258]